ncbi:MAG TPA: efflux RND transporter periplasmic adaptor subunit [Chitinophagales bacterium]|jgi:RND family efflux transporter MFP subunit|nr:efflux RND transporter periplasmic adaptor subunit [Chitinophagales bacterium]HQV77753.1 efflux RND transporter periplasmic adaptor subunit [Chitinophagales bacterium]HQW78227.1 efflux RND transporter periplasmic adaptor subunit [Chitinophagales bacterium]HRB68653.1 efflux RND transporter periplasmic adaptor subunit [Chitinophagales bacterium]
MKNKIIIGIIVALLIGGMIYKLAANKKTIDKNASPIDRSNVPVSVSTFEVNYFTVSTDYALPAVLDNNNTGIITATQPGKLATFNIEIGQHVTKGQLIGKIDSKQREIGIKSSDATIKKLEDDIKRTQDLIAGDAAPANAINDLNYNLETVKIQKENYLQQIADNNIYAPISGVIVQKNTNAGEFANSGTPLATIMDVSILKAIVYVSENNVYDLHVGQSAQVTSDIFPDKITKGIIKYIAPKGDENHNYKVEVHIPNSGYKAGTYVQVKFSFKKPADALQIPKMALVEGVKNPYVYVVNGNSIAIRKIVLGEEVGQNIIVRSGLTPGDKVVTTGQINLTEKSKIQIINEK